MTANRMAAGSLALHGEIFHRLDDPSRIAGAVEHLADGILTIRDGLVVRCGPATRAAASDQTLLPWGHYCAWLDRLSRPLSSTRRNCFAGGGPS